MHHLARPVHLEERATSDAPVHSTRRAPDLRDSRKPRRLGAKAAGLRDDSAGARVFVDIIFLAVTVDDEWNEAVYRIAGEIVFIGCLRWDLRCYDYYRV